MDGQLSFVKEANRRDIRHTILFNRTEMKFIRDGMERIGESKVNNYIRKLIQDDQTRSKESR